MDVLRREFDRASDLDARTRAAQSDLVSLAHKVADRIAGSNTGRIDSESGLLRELSSFQARLRDLQVRHGTVADGHDALAFRAALERRWTPLSALDRLVEEADQLANTIRAYSEVKSSRLLYLIGFYGFPLIFFGGFFQFIFQGIPDNLLVSGKSWTEAAQVALQKIHLPALLLYVGLSTLSIAVFRLIAWKSRRTHSKSDTTS